MGGVEWGDVGDQVQMVGVECGWETHHKKLSLEAGKRGFMFAPAGSRTLR